MNRATASFRHRATAQRERRATASAPARHQGADLMRAVDLWLADGAASGDSRRTMEDRRLTMQRVAWWLENEREIVPRLDSVTSLVMREFLSYLREDLPAGKGRWGSDHPSARRKMRPASVNAYYRILRAFLNWAEREGLTRERALANVPPPRIPEQPIRPFSADQQQQLLDGARRRGSPERDVAIIKTLLDSGMRVSELCSLRIVDLDREDGSIRVIGKGSKERSVYIGRSTRQALHVYLDRMRPGHHAEDPLFVAEGGHTPNEALTPSGVGHVIAKAGRAAGVSGVRCSPHTCRHTFAISALRNGMSLLELQEILGHEDLATVKIYVQLAEVDLQRAHRLASPVDRLNLR